MSKNFEKMKLVHRDLKTQHFAKDMKTDKEEFEEVFEDALSVDDESFSPGTIIYLMDSITINHPHSTLPELIDKYLNIPINTFNGVKISAKKGKIVIEKSEE